jgi:hypothetical protein
VYEGPACEGRGTPETSAVRVTLDLLHCAATLLMVPGCFLCVRVCTACCVTGITAGYVNVYAKVLRMRDALYGVRMLRYCFTAVCIATVYANTLYM